MKDLIEKLEKAEGPDPELEGQICAGVWGWKHISAEEAAAQNLNVPPGFCLLDNRSDPNWNRRADYTRSIDAALTPIPKGWWGGSYDVFRRRRCSYGYTFDKRGRLLRVS